MNYTTLFSVKVSELYVCLQSSTWLTYFSVPYVAFHTTPANQFFRIYMRITIPLLAPRYIKTITPPSTSKAWVVFSPLSIPADVLKNDVFPFTVAAALQK